MPGGNSLFEGDIYVWRSEFFSDPDLGRFWPNIDPDLGRFWQNIDPDLGRFDEKFTMI